MQRRTVPLPLTQKIFDTTWVRDLDPDQPDAPVPSDGSWLVLTEGAEAEEIARDFVSRFGFADPTSDQCGPFS